MLKNIDPSDKSIKPFKAPIEIHIIKVKMIAIQAGNPSLTIKIAIIIPAKPIMEPTERSNSPEIIKIAIPIATIMYSGVIPMTILMFLSSRNLGLAK